MNLEENRRKILRFLKKKIGELEERPAAQNFKKISFNYICTMASGI